MKLDFFLIFSLIIVLVMLYLKLSFIMVFIISILILWYYIDEYKKHWIKNYIDWIKNSK